MTTTTEKRRPQRVRTTCIAPDCDNEVRTRGMCGTHYTQWMKNGEFTIDPNADEDAKDTCSAPNCNRLAIWYPDGDQLCDRHYQRICAKAAA